MRRLSPLPSRLAPLLATLLATLAPPPASAQDLGLDGFLGVDGGSAGLPALSFLKLPVSARSIGLSTPTLTTDEEASVVHGNPAALALMGDWFYSLSHAEILGEFRHEDLTLALPRSRWGGFGLRATLLSATAFEDARDIDEEPASPGAYDAALGLAYGRGFLGDRLAAGVRLDLIRSSIDGTDAHGYAASFGLLGFLVGDWRVGAALHNLSHGIRYGGAGSPVEPLPLTLGIEAGKPLLGSRWSAHAGVSQGNEGILKYYAGGEFRVLKHLLLRAGWDGSAQDRELGGLGGLAAGTGVKYDRLALDYGYKTLGLAGSYHAVTLNYSRKAVLRAADEVWLERALARQRKGRYASALKAARAAVAANPYNFKAQALASQLQLELDRLDETAFSIYFTGGTEGRLASEWRDGRPLGGLARRRTKLLELKGAGGRHLVLDAGNLTPPSAGRGGERYVHAAYARMPYDAVNVGAGELSLGPDAWSPDVPWLASQEPVAGLRRGLMGEKTLRLKGGVEVLVLGALDPAEYRAPGNPGASGAAGPLEAAAAAVRRRIAERPAGKPGRILVLLFQGSLLSARRLAQLAPELDVILIAGESQALGSPMRVGRTLLCSPGRGGTHVGHLTLTVDGKRGGITSFRHFLLPLDASVAEDAGIKALLAPVTLDPGRLALDDYDEEYRAQVLAYVRAPIPGQGGRIVLRDLRTGREFPLPPASSHAGHASRPILGFGKNKVAFLAQDSAGLRREVYALELGSGRLDTLTRAGGDALDIRWILGNNALLAAYGPAGGRDLWRIDPWSREARNLGGGRFGDVRGFDVDKAGERLAVLGVSDGLGTVWVTSLGMESPQAVAADRGVLGPPRWDPQGRRLAFLVGTDGDGGSPGAPGPGSAGGMADAPGKPGEAAGGELRVFDFAERRLVPVTLGSRVRDFAWSPDGNSIYYAAGVNLLDLNEYRFDSLSVRKVTSGATPGGTGDGAGPRSEEHPVPKMLDGREGLLFEAATDGRRRILWVDLATREEKVLADSAGCNSLR